MGAGHSLPECVCTTVCVGESEREKLGLTLWSLNQQSLKSLVCANFYGPIGGLAQHGRSYPVKVKFIFITHNLNVS